MSRKLHNCHSAPCNLNSNKLFITLSDRYRNPACDLRVCLYLNLKNGDLDHLTTTAGHYLMLLSQHYYQWSSYHLVSN